jgi:P-type Ca2+ transporter type 2C
MIVVTAIMASIMEMIMVTAITGMSLRKLFARGEFWDIGHSPGLMPEAFHGLLEFSILASQIDPFDPMEKAIRELGEQHLAQTDHLHQNWALVHEYPLSKELLALSRVWKSPSGSDYVIAAKGAPEAIADLCHFDETQRKDLTRHINTMAEDGLRVLGVALLGVQRFFWARCFMSPYCVTCSGYRHYTLWT